MQKSVYDPLFEAIDRELAKRKAEGKPLRVNIWDGVHQSPIPRSVTVHSGLRNVVRKYGQPAYVIETVRDAERLEGWFEQHRLGTPSERREAEAELKGRNRLMDGLLRASKKGAAVIFPDPRSDEFDAAGFTPAEIKMWARLSKEIDARGLECASVTQERFVASLSPAERAIADSFAEKYTALAKLGDERVDRVVAENVNQALPDNGRAGKTIPIMLYGAGHFGKKLDLNEHLPGVDVAIYRSPSASAALRQAAPHLANDLPQMVWYSDQKRLVKLDNDKAKMEYLGFKTVDQLRLWEQNPPQQAEAAFPELSESARRQCEAAAQHLRCLPGNTCSGQADHAARA